MQQDSTGNGRKNHHAHRNLVQQHNHSHHNLDNNNGQSLEIDEDGQIDDTLESSEEAAVLIHPGS